MDGWNKTSGWPTRIVTWSLLMLTTIAAYKGLAQHIETSNFNQGPARAKEDPTVVAHGEQVYTAKCQTCHGADLRGATGPSVLRSQASLTDKKGEYLVPIMQGQDKSFPGHKIDISLDDSAAVAAYIRSIVSQIGSQGRPPGDGQQPINVVVGDAARGKEYFAAKCASCHSAEGDLKGYATRVPIAKSMQSAWVRGNRLGVPIPPVKVTVSSARMKPTEGTLIHIDDFLLTMQLADGTMHTIRRNGDVPKVVVKDPLEGHRNLLPVYTDGDIHNVTAYLVTLK